MQTAPGRGPALLPLVSLLPLLLPLACMTPVAVPPPTAPAQRASGGALVRYQDDKLLLPADYRNWVYLSSGIDMSYSDLPSMMDHSMFDNVFADPASYAGFLATGHWPEGTVLVTEARMARQKGSINKKGQFQSREVMGLEVHVKDQTRFAQTAGWGFFAFGSDAPAALLPASAACYACHQEHGAVDTTFVQFYPTLLEVAEKKGTARAAQ